MGPTARPFACLLALALGAFLVADAAAGDAKRERVTISGKAYRFNHMDTYIEGAVVRVRERPGLEAVTDENGDYALEVPDDTDVTPYIDPPDPYNEIDLQTFHPRGRDIVNANFQTPHDNEYNALAAILDVPMGSDGRPESCVVVTTVSARNVRGVDYETFHERTPHGVAGATAEARPAVPGPVYFNEFVIPDRNETESSEDGGVIWPEVPRGPFRFIAEHPSTRFASFLATCRPGRIINANPPWGAYELRGDERQLKASGPAGSLTAVAARREHGRRTVSFDVHAGEPLDLTARLPMGRAGTISMEARIAKRGSRTFHLPISAGMRRRHVTLRAELTDAGGVSRFARERIRLPRPKGSR